MKMPFILFRDNDRNKILIPVNQIKEIADESQILINGHFYSSKNCVNPEDIVLRINEGLERGETVIVI
jgi:hypothetical protein